MINHQKLARRLLRRRHEALLAIEVGHPAYTEAEVADAWQTVNVCKIRLSAMPKGVVRAAERELVASWL